MAQEGEHDQRVASSPYVSSVGRQGGSKREVASAKDGTGTGAAGPATGIMAPVGGTGGSNDTLLMKRTLVTQSKKIQQLTEKIDGMENEALATKQQVSLELHFCLML